MRAWQVRGHGEPGAVMALTETEIGEPGPGELVVDVHASALGLPDVLMCRGSYPLTPALPFTPGQEFVGTVSAAGPGAMTPVGTRVMGVAAFMIGRGAYAAQCKTYDPMIFPAADDMDDATASAFTIAYHTGYIALVRRAKLVAGETLLVHGGAGGTGYAAIQLGKALGARVIATAGGAEKAAFCREVGADLVIDHTQENFVDIVNAATGGRGADIVYDPVGGAMFEDSTRCIAQEGRLLPIGFACGRWGTVSPETLALKNIAIVGALGGGFDRAYMLRMHDTLLTLHRAGKIRVVVSRRIGFDAIGAAVQSLADRQVLGRIAAVY
jgi:NADPH2:quinone reductase